MPDIGDPGLLVTVVQVAGGMVASVAGLLVPRLQRRIKNAREQQLIASKALGVLDVKARELFGYLQLYVRHCPAQLARIREGLLAGSGPFTAPHWYSPFDKGRDDVHIETHQHNFDVESARFVLCKAAVPQLQIMLDTNLASVLSSSTAELEALAKAHPDAESVPHLIGRVTKAATAALEQLLLLERRTSDQLGSAAALLLVIVVFGLVGYPFCLLLGQPPVDRFAIGALVAAVTGCTLVCIQVHFMRRLARYTSFLPPSPTADAND